MSDPPPLMRDQRKIDQDHLRLLAIFHFVFAGLLLLGIAFLFLHYEFMHAIFSNPDMWKGQKNPGPPPEKFFAIFVWFYAVFGTMLVVGSLGNLLSGMFIRQNRHRVFSLVISGFNVLQFPLGTVLGIFTMIVLLRDSVRAAYERTGDT